MSSRFWQPNAKYWTLDKIKRGFEKFLTEHGRPPTAREIDSLDYLPTSRTIQRSFGGLEKLRTELGLPITHFGKGEQRSNIAKNSNKRGYEAELMVYELLIQKFGEMLVHLEKPFGNSKKRIDFYVYSPDGNFGVDVFYPDDLYNMNTNINSKITLYTDFIEENYLVVANPNISQEQIDKTIENKIRRLPQKCKVYSLAKLIDEIKDKKAYKLTK